MDRPIVVRLDGNKAPEGRYPVRGGIPVVEQVATMDDAAGGPRNWPAPAWPRREHEVAIFLTAQNRILIQGITGSEGSRHGARMVAAGTTVVGGTNPLQGHAQTVELNGTDVPVLGTVADTMAATGADVSVVFVPTAGTKAAVIEAIDARIPLCIVITEGVPCP